MKKRLSILTLIVMFLVCLIPLNVRAEESYIYYVPTLVSETNNLSGKWKHNKNGWWFEFDSGGYAKNQFLTFTIKENSYYDYKTYYFDNNGYMATGWRKIYGELDYFQALTISKNSKYNWYYFHSNGELCKDEFHQGYYLNPQGIMMEGKFIWKKAYYQDRHWEWRYYNEQQDWYFNTYKDRTDDYFIKIDNKLYVFDSEGNLYRNIYNSFGTNTNIYFCWVDKNGVITDTKLQPLNYNNINESPLSIGYKWKSTDGWNPNGAYIFKCGYNYYAITFANGTVIDKKWLNINGYDINRNFTFYDYDMKSGIYKVIRNSNGKIISFEKLN